MKPTGKEKGLIINNEVDERYHLEKSTKAACNYLKEAYEKFGSWTLAAASYNMGITGIEKQMTRQKATNYYDLLLNNETARYVFRICAIKEILEHQKTYGFHVRKKDMYSLPTIKQVILDSSVANFAEYAQQLNINYKILKEYNPWLRQSHLENKSGWAYLIDLPKNGHYTSENKIENIELDNSNFSIEYDTIKIKVTKGDQLKNVAKASEIEIEDLILQNIEALDIKVKKGQELQLIKESER